MVNEIVGAGLSAVAGVYNNELNVQAQRENNELQVQEAQKNREFQWDMLKENQRYNSALSQRRRLEEAGLNPDMMYSGQGASAAAGQSIGAGNPVQPQTAAAMRDPLIAQQSALLAAQLFKMRSEKEGQDLHNEEKKVDVDVKKQFAWEQAAADLGLTQEQTNYYVAAGKNLDVQCEKLRKEMELFDQKIATMKEQLKQIVADTNLKNKQALTQEELAKLYSAQCAGIELDNEMKKIIKENLPAKIQSEIAANWAAVNKANSEVSLNKNLAEESTARKDLFGEQKNTEKKRQGLFESEAGKFDSEAAINRIDERTRHVKNVFGIVESGTRSLENLTKSYENVASGYEKTTRGTRHLVPLPGF